MSDAPQSEAMPYKVSFLRRHVRALIASVALAAGLGWIMHKGALPLLPPQGTLDRVDWFRVALLTLSLIVSIGGRFVRWAFLLAPFAKVPFRRLMAISCISVGLITFLPFRLGEVARPAMLRQKGKISGWAVTGTVGAERIIDGVLFSVMLLLGLAFAAPHEPLPERIGNLPVPAAYVPRAAMVASIFFGFAFLCMAAFFWWRATARRLTERVLGLFSQRVATLVATAVERVSDGLSFLPNLRYTVPYVLLTVFALVAHIWGIQQLALAVGLPDLTFAEATVLVGVLGLGFAMPNAPGFFGSVQLALYAGLAVYVAPEKVIHEGAAFVFLFYVSYLVLVILLSLLGVLLEYGSSAEAVGIGTPLDGRSG
ncbi:MAG TPA: lysylphosphatidylglycerol synthase transmembrane domain-containing protein [Polyangiaceae bacterium]|nr:lysylphosphatidylglycerol synthase transmembrane domain-containing protein [Polyangiaceae bacterium]